MVGAFFPGLNMSAQTSPAEKGLNPGLLCQESYTCSGTDEAVFECDECCSLQCLRCEEELHRQERLRNHERIRLKAGHVPYCDPCKGPSGHSPGVKQRAVVRCQTCKINLCLECQKRTHSGGNRRRHPVTVYHVAKVQELLEEEGMDEDTKRKKMTEKVVSFLLVDENEEVQVTNEEDFIRKLDCKPDQHLKVVSIFGNTGDGKSHTLNHTFFYGREVFKTSPAQESCTVGVWAAYDPVHKVAVIDTEGLLGATVNLSQRTRLLLKVLAISDLVIYRTHADRLHNDLFKFLGDASEAYLKHFTKELKATTARCGLDVPLSTLGPAVIIFHETVHTQLLGSDHPSEVPEKLIQDRFRKLGRFPEAFSSIHYKGTRTYNPPTDFSGLRRALEQQLENNTTRSPRHPGVIFKALKALSDRFSGEIPDDQMAHSSFFPDEYFTCSVLCLSCGAGCKNSMNHGKEGVPHEANSRCRYSHQYDNRVFTCKACYERGNEVSVVPKTAASTDSPWMGLAKYAWSGYVIECPNCGVVYRSRQYWFGNQDPVDTVVRTEIVHVWPGTDGFLKDNNNAAQRLLDGMNFMAQSVSELSLGPTKAVTSWLTDQIAPAYWRPNSQILSCNKCATSFKDNDTKHHCRACGEGFCDSCSSKTRPVPERGWGPAPVRVCDNCYEARNSQLDVTEAQADDEGGTLIARKVGEAVQNTLGAVVTAIDIPLGLVKDAARPAYWVPDHEILHCHNCRKEFSVKLSKHHCRACGQGFCDECSHDRRAVPSRGWDHPVRVCFNCNKKPGDL
ncbi:zinc finger FYVE domain-containing protein 1 [Globicephala melas]|uniref:Zinc finger FYVE domain-containing protein 1 n=3 Tax=Odontoceti TaxID=9722 RepID=A0A6J3QYB1_TURTR|nr:zinc finger FYVE domain-containing protein 1 [Lagenorhynchus obliquidens]XP_026967477.1 zinc finger FYVE domain-containing protein 1 [Lagenorhynchus obliquidens]XP_026967478.1 zinc finger FYVE domain-containing protein 1 [Lagenorhynchus obliquidens]XP_026967479.1 zinc finger FYVE domain-containing protein 1 [Lagenorhynchus obliquidens]XP_030687441.1 zinc finger FYVE domain-containing protein 1 [Globicephala melas]XP_030687442.1 zinc finger FYVE domain-containing protein 1 [Globicephala mela